MCNDPKIKPNEITKEKLKNNENKDKIVTLNNVWAKLTSSGVVDPTFVADGLRKVQDALRKELNLIKEDDASDLSGEYDHKMHDADVLRNVFLGLDLNKKDLNADEREKIEKSVRDVMHDLAHDDKFDVEHATEKQLKDKHLTDDEIREILKMQGMLGELENKAPVDVKHLATELDDVINDIRKSARHIKEDKDAQEGDEYNRKMHDADVLRDELLHLNLNLPNVPKDEREKIEKSVRDVMQDIVHDPKIHPENMTDDEIKHLHLSPEEIDELLKLKHIMNKLEDDKPLNPNQLANELDVVIDEIRKDADQSRIDDNKEADSFDRLMNDANKLRDAMLDINLSESDIPDSGRKQMENTIAGVMGDIAHNPNINPATITEKQLKKMDLTQEEIDEILKLKGLYTKLESDKPVDPNLLAAELEDVINDIRISAQHSRMEKDFENEDSEEKKLHDADLLRDQMLHIDLTKKNITEDNKECIEKSIRDVVKDLTHGKVTDVEHVTKKQLKNMDLTQGEIDEIMKLKGIYVDLEDGKLNSKKIAADLKSVVQSMRASVENSRVHDQSHQRDDLERQLDDANKLRDEMLHIDISKRDIGDDQRLHIEKSIRDVMNDISHGQITDPHGLKPKDIKNNKN